jgi:hypothetical protein
MGLKLQEVQKLLDAEMAENKLCREQILHVQNNKAANGMEQELKRKVAEMEAKVNILQNELKKETTVRLQSSEGVSTLQSELRKESTIRSELAKQAESKEVELKVLKAKYEALLVKLGLTECPFCSQNFALKEIQAHVDSKH